MEHRARLGNLLSVSEYAKIHGILDSTAIMRVRRGIINPADVIILPKKVKIFIKKNCRHRKGKRKLKNS